MNEGKKDNPNLRQTVASVGNSWIVSQSKSHPGHVYYFNTTTGEAVWNLSNAEIEKARMTTKTLQDKHGSNITVGPEPMSNPPIHQMLQNEFNRIDKLNQEQQSILAKTQQQSQNIFQQQQTLITDLPMNNIPAFNLNALNNQVNAFNIVRTPSVFNSNIWEMPHPQQIFITPTLPMVNQAQASLNLTYNDIVQNDQTISLGFKHFQNKPRMQRRFVYPKNHSTYGKQKFRNKFRSPMKNNDLRQQLTAKSRLIMNKNKENTKEDASACTRSTLGTADLSSYIADMIEECIPSNNNTLVDNCSKDNETEEQLTLLNLSPLKCLAPSNTYKHIWCVVVDLKVLLNEYKFLNILLNSDENCHLTIPQSVMSELKNFIATTNNVPARRIYLSLSKKIETGGVSIASEPSPGDEDTIITSPILKTSLKLLAENYHVILLTSDSKMISYKKFIKINMFTVDEVKLLLEENSKNDKYETNLPNSRSLSISPKFQLTPQKTLQFITSENNKPTQETVINDNNLDNNIGGESITLIDLEVDDNIQDARPNLKSVVDAEIQTEESVKSKDTNPDVVPNKGVLLEKLVTYSDAMVPSKPLKRREIRLKRNTSQQPTECNSAVNNNNDKKSFRWRRRPNSCSQAKITSNNNETCLNSMDNRTITSVSTNTETNETVKQTEEITNKQENYFASNTGSRESSIICMDIARENIIIEETSMSGIISNTESNFDNESVFNNYKENCNEESNSRDVSDIFMYEVDNESMEESLKSRRTEWVSRLILIMEKVLVAVLHKEPEFLKKNPSLPPPWTIHEALQYIRMCSNHDAIQYASDKLSTILYDISDYAGKVLKDLEPCQFMEMYSYGVHLLNAIKVFESNSEDITIALESLQKLLSDIKDPYYGTNYSVTRNSVIENSPNIQTDDLKKGANSKSPAENSQNSPQSSKYNLRSRRRILESEPSEPPQSAIKIIRNIDIKSSFFESLKLKQIASVTETNAPIVSKDKVEEQDQVIFSSHDKVTNEPSNTPTIVRNFTKFAEFEERLKNKFKTDEYEAHDYMDNEEDDYEYSDEWQSDECDTSDDDTLRSDPNVTQIFDTSDIDIPENLVASSPKPVEPCVGKDSNYTFRLLTCMFLQEVRKAINEVKVLCDKCLMRLKNPELPIEERKVLRKGVENAELHLVGLCRSLESMLNRDPNAPTNNIQTALEKAGIDMSQVDEQLLLGYWDTIDSCKKQADVFLHSIREIIAVF